MYSSLPKSLKAECLVRTKVEENEDVLRKRQHMVDTKKPAELAQFNSLADFPLPSRIENIFKSGGDKEPKAPPRRKAHEDNEDEADNAEDGKRK